MSLAPIVLFVYNRPEHTRRTLEALKANKLSRKSVLYIFADGAKPNASNSMHIRVQQVRRIIRSEPWCEQVVIEESKTNKGLADSIVHGVSSVLAKHEKAIVLEDDVVVSSGFLSYMNNALRFYQDVKSVMHVSGYMLPVEEDLPETFFYNSTSCWGWGTWQSAWEALNTNAEELRSQLQAQNKLKAFNLDGIGDYDVQLNQNISGQKKTWAVKWNASVFLKGGLCLHPKKSLVRNIGFDGTGENCSDDSVFNLEELAKNIEVKPITLQESQSAREAAKAFIDNINNPSFSHRAKRRFARFFGKE